MGEKVVQPERLKEENMGCGWKLFWRMVILLEKYNNRSWYVVQSLKVV